MGAAASKYPIRAQCEVAPKGKPCASQGGEESAPECHGLVTLEQISAGTTTISWDLKQCGKEGLHGFHIHEKADFSNGCISAGPHYNPENKTHGGPGGKERHVGDLGNIVIDANGSSRGSMQDHMVKLEGPWSVLGRSMMIHADPDDLGRGDNSMAHVKPPQNGKVSKVTGNAGARIACGEIVKVP